jgi:mono/diheme cytochrome c family protein
MRFLAFIGGLAIVAAIAAGVFFFGGFYNVGATSPDPGIVAWSLQKVRIASIKNHATEQPSVNVDDPAIIKAGARAFATRGCVECHGGPGADWAKFSEAMRPGPPDLKDVAKVAPVEGIFWVIKNGINMTGMPGFSLIGIDDKELWSIAAFVKKLPQVSDEDYKAWSTATQ